MWTIIHNEEAGAGLIMSWELDHSQVVIAIVTSLESSKNIGLR
jgi:hypothetical protein